MAQVEREARAPRPGRGTPLGDAIFSLGRAHGDFCGLIASGVLSAEDRAAEKAALVRRLAVVSRLIDAL